MPIIAEGEEEPNDTFREQLISSAEAAVKVSSAATELGLSDSNVLSSTEGAPGDSSKSCAAALHNKGQ